MAYSNSQELYMERDLSKQLVVWKDSPFRKPLIVRGARQVGKTRALKRFGTEYYKSIAYFSLEKINARTPSEYAQFFETTKDPRRIVQNLSLISGVPIEPGATLLILDEIQDCPAALTALKYFCEEAPEYHVACAGSLLGVALASEDSFPVGKVSFIDAYPMTFSEFLRATGSANLDTYCRGVTAFGAVPDAFAERLMEKLRIYLCTGGMPEAVARWVVTGDMGLVDDALADLVDSYERDFAKHGGARMYAKISAVWNSLPSQLARENKKFLYGIVREGARAREYEDAIVWLKNAGLLYKVPLSSKPGIPMSAYDEEASFKTYAMDVGVLRRLARLSSTAFATTDGLFAEFKGAFAENYVLQALKPQLEVDPRYWTNDKPRHEVDFLIQLENRIVPIEVKAGMNVKSPSLRYYANKYPEATPLRVRLSQRNLSFDEGVLNIPLYLADEATRLIGLALEASPGA